MYIPHTEFPTDPGDQDSGRPASLGGRSREASRPSPDLSRATRSLPKAAGNLRRMPLSLSRRCRGRNWTTRSPSRGRGSLSGTPRTLPLPTTKAGGRLAVQGQSSANLGEAGRALGEWIGELGETLLRLGRPCRCLGRTPQSEGETSSDLRRSRRRSGETSATFGQTSSPTGRTPRVVGDSFQNRPDARRERLTPPAAHRDLRTPGPGRPNRALLTPQPLNLMISP